MLDFEPGTNQYWAMRVKFLAQGNNGVLSHVWQAHTFNKLDKLTNELSRPLIPHKCWNLSSVEVMLSGMSTQRLRVLETAL